MDKSKALIIGAGPNLVSNLGDYRRLGKFDGVVICTDGAINKVLDSGFIPDYVATLEDTPDLDKYYVTETVKKKGKLITNGAIISDRVHNNCRKAIQDAGMKWQVAADLRGFITSNVGLFSWLYAITTLKCKEVYLIGMDHCYPRDSGPPVPRDSELFKYGFKVLVNPYDGEEIILHPAYELWMEEFNWYTEKHKDDVTTINCTGRGALFKKTFKWQPISIMTKDWQVI